MLQIIRNGLNITAKSDMEYGQGSVNAKVELINDASYNDYAVQMHCGFINQNNETQDIILDETESGLFVLPQDVFINSSPLYLAVGLSKGDEILKTEQLRFVVKKSPDGNVILPEIATWQELVSDYTRELNRIDFEQTVAPALATAIQDVEVIKQEAISSTTLIKEETQVIADEFEGDIVDINAEITQLKQEIENIGTSFLQTIYKVGDIFLSFNSDNPSLKFGGTWALTSQGRVLVGVDTSDSDFNSVKKTGGSKEMQAHSHKSKINSLIDNKVTGTEPTKYGYINTGVQSTVDTTEAGQGDSQNLQPYMTCYIWEKTA